MLYAKPYTIFGKTVNKMASIFMSSNREKEKVEVLSK